MQNAYALDNASASRKSVAGERTDEALIQSIAAGDKHAVKVLYTRYSARLYRFILRFIPDQSRAV